MIGNDSTTLAFPYGRDTVTVEVPRRCLLPLPELRCEPALRNPARAVRQALGSPIGTERLRDLARGWPDCVIAVPDHTRWAPVSIMLSPLLEELHGAGLSAEQITILVAVGTHRAMSREELRRHLGPAICDRYRVRNHDWRDESNLVRLGATRRGTPVVVNRLYHEAALKVALGSVKPHGVVGWGGGAKILQPGLGDGDGAGVTHWRSAQAMGREIIGRVETEIRHDIEEAADRIGLDFLLQGAPNNREEMIGFFAGDFREAFRRAVGYSVERSEFFFNADLGLRAEILITGTTGLDMWSGGSAGMWLAEYLLEPGGTVVQFAPCSEGVASEHPDVARYGYRSLAETEALLDSGAIIDRVAAAHMVHGGRVLDRMGVECILFSDGLTREEVERLRLTYASSPQEAVDMAFARHGRSAIVQVFGELDRQRAADRSPGRD